MCRPLCYVLSCEGLRGVMGPGYAAMNDLVIIQTSQGVAKYVEATLPEAKQKGVAVSFDGRYNSHRWALVHCGMF